MRVYQACEVVVQEDEAQLESKDFHTASRRPGAAADHREKEKHDHREASPPRVILARISGCRDDGRDIEGGLALYAMFEQESGIFTSHIIYFLGKSLFLLKGILI